MDEDNNEKVAEELFEFVKDYALLKWDDEVKRYESLIQQASNMQTAFSFSTAALFMIAPIAVEYKGKMSFEYLILVFASITFFLILSLLFASLAQNRGKLISFADIYDFENFVTNNFESFLSKAQRNKALAHQIEEVQLSASEKNRKMAEKIKWSMRFFYIAILLSVVWFIVSLYILFC